MDSTISSLTPTPELFFWDVAVSQSTVSENHAWTAVEKEYVCYLLLFSKWQISKVT